MAFGPVSRLTVPQARLAARRDTREADHAPPLLTKLLPHPHYLIHTSSSAHPNHRVPFHLITGRAARLCGLCMVSTAVEFAVLVEVDEIHQQLLADGAGEAGGVPHSSWARSRGSDADVSTQDSIPALQGNNVMTVLI